MPVAANQFALRHVVHPHQSWFKRADRYARHPCEFAHQCESAHQYACAHRQLAIPAHVAFAGAVVAKAVRKTRAPRLTAN